VAVILLASIHPLLLGIVVFALPALLLGLQTQRDSMRLAERIREPRRLESQLRRLAVSAEAGKELRIFGLQQDIPERHRRVRAELDRMEDSVGIANSIRGGIGWLCFGVGMVLGLVFVLRLVLNGQASMGDMVLAVIALSQLRGQIGVI